MVRILTTRVYAHASVWWDEENLIHAITEDGGNCLGEKVYTHHRSHGKHSIHYCIYNNGW